MSETLTVRENILDNLKTVLSSIAAGSTYNNTFPTGSVQRFDHRSNTTVLNPRITITAGPETQEDEPNPLTTCTLTVFLDLWSRQDESSTDPTDKILNSLLRDITKAIKTDITRGGYAIDSQIRSVLPFDAIEGNPESGLIIELEIKYQHLQTDPAIAG